MVKKYNIIYADPPWHFNNKNTGGGLDSGSANKYKVMGMKQICELPVPAITADDCALLMWWVASQPESALEVVKAWGFTLKTMTAFNWVKTTSGGKPFFGMGFWTRAGSECCLLAVKGKIKRVNASIRSVYFEQNTEHSRKPDVFRNKTVELFGDMPRLEMFARQRTEGWDVFGDQVEGSIEL